MRDVDLHPMRLMTEHHFTVDVEEYFQVSAFEPWVPRERWASMESRVESNVRQLVELLAEHHARGTFFVLGWIAERHPRLVREIVDAGHEIASHGWDHRRVTEQTAEQFRRSVADSRRALQDISGQPVHGFRAPSFSLIAGCEWALDILLEEGYTYDSSLFPIRRRGYGYVNGQRDPHWIERPAGRIAELPPATLNLAGITLPAAGGAYFRLLPYGLVRSALRESDRRGVPGTFYIHPWELDPGQPKLRVPFLTRVRHYGGLQRTVARLRRLLTEFRFVPIAQTVARL
jgi:polysaccharide deacetylase family protein (PEP-CTERM system associated)